MDGNLYSCRSLIYSIIGLVGPGPSAEGKDRPDLVVIVLLALVIGPEVGHGEDGHQHDAGHQAELQHLAERAGWLLVIITLVDAVVTVLVVANELLGPE